MPFVPSSIVHTLRQMVVEHIGALSKKDREELYEQCAHGDPMMYIASIGLLPTLNQETSGISMILIALLAALILAVASAFRHDPPEF